MDWHYLALVLKGVFWDIKSIPAYVGLATLLLRAFPQWEGGKMKWIVQKIREHPALVCLSFIMVSLVLVSHELYVNKPTPPSAPNATELMQSPTTTNIGHNDGLNINAKEVFVNPPASSSPPVLSVADRDAKDRQDTKQAIRSFLESLRPDVLAKVDAGEKQIGVWLGSVNQTKLSTLSERPWFDSFLSFKKTKQMWIIMGEAQMGDFIRPTGEDGTLIGHYLYPKDSLIR
jgi:hypothetical protein